MSLKASDHFIRSRRTLALGQDPSHFSLWCLSRNWGGLGSGLPERRLFRASLGRTAIICPETGGFAPSSPASPLSQPQSGGESGAPGRAWPPAVLWPQVGLPPPSPFHISNQIFSVGSDNRWETPGTSIPELLRPGCRAAHKQPCQTKECPGSAPSSGGRANATTPLQALGRSVSRPARGPRRGDCSVLQELCPPVPTCQGCGNRAVYFGKKGHDYGMSHCIFSYYSFS